MRKAAGSIAAKSLILASILTLSMTGVYASEDTAKGTLDKLAGQDIPNTDPVQQYPSSGSAYTLTKLQEGGEKPTIANVITKYVYNTETQTMTPIYYKLDLKQTTYGKGSASQTFTLDTEPVKDVEITAKYNDLSDKIYDTEYKGTNYTGTVTEGGDYLNPKQEIHSALQNTSGNTISIENAIFKNNSTVINFNKTSSASSTKYLEVIGGAIYNAGTIENITADFVNNSVTGNRTDSNRNPFACGGAIFNANTIGDITGNFIGNYASAGFHAYGGAIYNANTIGDITGDFIGNYAKSSDSTSNGGAIYNDSSSQIGNITGNFIGNYASAGSIAEGGAIYNYINSQIGNITGNFIGNYASGSRAYGGAIYSFGTNAKIEDITGDFIGNYVSGADYAEGGAIYSYGTKIEDITGDFIGNYASAGSTADGGAIYNSSNSQIGNITGDFISNYGKSSSSSVYGGAVANYGTITNITGDFIGNYALSYSKAYGGAIYNYSKAQIGNITGDFIGNYASSSSSVDGGAIYNDNTIGDITGDFIGNYASAYYIASGGAIYNYDTITSITGDFIGNYALSYSKAYGGAIYNYSYSQIGNITGDFIGNFASSSSNNAYGGAIYSYGTNAKIEDITGDFIGNYASSSSNNAYGGAIDNDSRSQIGNITGDFIGNFASSSSNNAYGGAIYNKGTIGEIQGSFINNYAKSETGEAKGGAIYTTKDITIVAKDGFQSIFRGNYTESNGIKDDNAIYLDNPEGTLSFKMTNGGSIYMSDNIDGTVKETDGTITSAYKVDIQGDSIENTMFYMLNDIRKADVTVGNTTLNTINNQAHTYSFNTFTLTGDTNMLADVDLAKGEMDRFSANNYGTHQGNLHVLGMNMLSDAPKGQDVTEIYFAQVGLKDNVINGVNETPTANQTTAHTPIYKYNVMYDNREDAGYFLFTKGDKIFVPDGNGGTTVNPTPGGNPSDAFNPSVLASSVASQVGTYAAQNAAFNYAFSHSDSYMPLPSSERFAISHSNQYAINETPNYTTNLGDYENKAIWVRPYTSFENVPLKNGPKVDTINYGTLIGGDSEYKELRNGWGTVFTGYMGYNGSSQSYSGVNTYQNGGLIGATQTFYKGNFFTGLTASVGATAGESHNMYGHENFSSLMAGIASKTGYNLEFKNGKYIIQPTMMLAYSFINTFDYRNSAGVKINSDPLHAIQINPNIRFIANLKNGWQPYASVGMVWNILDDTKVMANDVRLPEMSIKPYVQYGIGIQRRWKDKYTGYVQAMIRNGGRNGIAITGGFRWALGKEGNPIQKVSNPLNKTAQVLDTTNSRKIIKQLSQDQRTVLGARAQNTTKTTNVKTLKQI